MIRISIVFPAAHAYVRKKIFEQIKTRVFKKINKNNN